jgi:coenzyme F420-reducing hydrogenase gamma subunit
MKYLGIEPRKPKIAVFDFTGCEGCELQLANKEEMVADFLQAVTNTMWPSLKEQSPAVMKSTA